MEVIEHNPRQALADQSPAGGWQARLERALAHPHIGVAILVVAALGSLLAWWLARQAALDDAHQRLAQRADAVQRRIETRLAEHESLLRGGVALFAAGNQPPGREAWQRYVQTLQIEQRHPGLQGLGVSQVVLADSNQAPPRAPRDDTRPNAATPPDGGRDLSSAIVYLEPAIGRNRQAFGQDLLAEPVRREAMLRARDSGQAAVSGAVTLLRQDGQDVQPGVLMVLPVYLPEPAAADARRGAGEPLRLWGWVHAPMTVAGLMAGVLDPDQTPLRLRVHDGAADPGRPPLYASADQAAGATVLSRTVDVGGRRWTLALDADPAAEAATGTSHLVAACGLAINLLLLWNLRSNHRRRTQVEHEVAELGEEASTRLAWLTAISGLSPDAILVFARAADGEHRLVFTNPAFSDWFGLHPEDLHGLSEHAVGEWLDGLSDGSTQDGGEPLLGPRSARVTLAGPPLRVLQRGMREDDRQRVYYYRDITHETEVERLKNEFLTTAAHELRTPLASVYGFAELLQTDRFEPARRLQMTRIVYRQAGVLNHLVNELLDLARMDSRRGRDFTLQRTDLREVAELAAESVLRADAPPRVQLQLGDEAQWVSIDPLKTQQAVVNLLSNALKYSGPDSPVTLRLLPGVHDGRSGVTLQVQDHGIGMTEAQVARAFERFYRADTSGHQLGAGLGLSIVDEIVGLQGGHVRIHSTPGVGTEVSVWLPAAQEAANNPDSPQAEGTGSGQTGNLSSQEPAEAAEVSGCSPNAPPTTA